VEIYQKRYSKMIPSVVWRPYDLAKCDMMSLILTHMDSNQTGVDVFHTMCSIAKCVDEYVSSPSADVTFAESGDIGELLTLLAEYHVSCRDRWDLVQGQVGSAVVFAKACIPPGFVYDGGQPKVLRMEKIVTTPTVQILGCRLRIRVLYQHCGFRVRIDDLI
jgi:hypothetical protein